ncbi:nucleolin [Forsythia ovata]|uniref:Nucleolin n=1 Tax=Forsythia ovata TaxID=205694 RepID=A0ABD1UWE6_9LAMI
MADLKIGEEEHASPVKRKSDPPESIEETLDEEEHEADSIKKRKLDTLSYNDAFSRKGKGISRDDKGKGKLIEESEDDDDDSSDDHESELSGVDSDLSDDPLAEVDMENILPSRTRRRAAQPGLHISNDRHLGSDP